MSLFSKHDLQRIAVAQERAEHKTNARIEIVSTDRSNGYHYFRMLGTVALTLVVAAIFFIVLNNIQSNDWSSTSVDAARWVWWSQFPVALCSWWLCGWTPVLRRITPKRVCRNAVSDQTKLTYLDINPLNQAVEPVVLIYLSALERRVELLASPQLDSLLGEEVWGRHISMLVSSIQQHQATEGMCNVLEALGAQLAVVLPSQNVTQTELDRFNHDFRNDAA